MKPNNPKTRESSLLLLEHAADARKFEIDLFWRRSLFFWGFITVAIVGYVQLQGVGILTVQFAFACLGLLCSVAWTLANRGSKYWQEAWEQKIKRIEMDVFGEALYSKIEQPKNAGFWGARRYSVSRLAIAISDLVVLFWFFLVSNSAYIAFANEWGYFIVLIATLAYLVSMLVGGRSKDRPI